MYILRLAEAISSLQEVRQELEKKLQRIQHLRRSCEGTRKKKCVYCKKKNITHSTSAWKLRRQKSERFDYVYVFVRHQTRSVSVAYLSVEHVSSVGVGSSETQARSTL